MSTDTEFAAAVRDMRSEPKLVTAVFRFYGGPEHEREAAEAWAFELTYYFLRGVGEQPAVTYDAGVYTVSGLMQTTHPGDRSPVTVFNGDSEPSSLDFCVDPDRAARLREMYPGRTLRWDGRD